MKTIRKNILIAPLNWGLGHATRCIPLVHELEKNNFTPIIASDGAALALLKKEFPHLMHLELPSYHIEYSTKAKNLKWELLKNSPKTISAIISEKKIVKEWCTKLGLCGIISDNRLGVYNINVPSVIITHQLRVLSGRTTWISSKIHHYFIKKFTECWVPDYGGNFNFSGKLGHLKDSKLNIQYIGTLSRLEKLSLPIQYDLMVLLSGPEPQRTFLEEKLLKELKNYEQKVIFIKGIIEQEQKKEVLDTVTIYNFMTSKELEIVMNQSDKILCRSGYTTIMDLIKLRKKAFFIPTPGQFEQEYLAKKMKQSGILPYAKQDSFNIEMLKEVEMYKGFPTISKPIHWKNLFNLFESE
ncbi:glycosyltransferase [Flavobacterium sp.]